MLDETSSFRETAGNSQARHALHEGLLKQIESTTGFRLVEQIGAGAFGHVWRALGPGAVPAASKIVQIDQAEATEVKALEFMKHVRHPNLMCVSGIWAIRDLLLVGMELADGTLADRIRQSHPESTDCAEVLDYMFDVARAIDYLNEPRHSISGSPNLAIIHRDIKPSNLLIVGGGVKVGDFGLARALQRTMGQASIALTPAYAPPEFFRAQVSQTSDQYSLAITYHELRTKQMVFQGSPYEVMAGHVSEAPNLERLDERERDIVARALSKQPSERWPDCQTFVRALVDAHSTAAPRSLQTDASISIDSTAATAPESTEIEWGTCSTPQRMLDALVDRTSDRKLRLFACACCRRVARLLTDTRLSDALKVTEQFLDGLLSREVLDTAHYRARAAQNELKKMVGAGDLPAKRAAATAVMMTSAPKAQFHFQGEARQTIVQACKVVSVQVSVAVQESRGVDSLEAGSTVQDELRVHCDLLRDIFGNPFLGSQFQAMWRTQRVTSLATLIYKDRAFDHMPLLGDALQEAGCDDIAVLQHCSEPWEHVRGCWVVDAILGKE